MIKPWYLDPGWWQVITGILTIFVTILIFRLSKKAKDNKELKSLISRKDQELGILNQRYELELKKHVIEMKDRTKLSKPNFRSYHQDLILQHDTGGCFLLPNTGGAATILSLLATGEPEIELSLDARQNFVNTGDNLRLLYRERLMPMQAANWTAEIKIAGDDGTEYILQLNSDGNKVNMRLA